MLRLVALVSTDISVELSASFIRVTRIGELGTTFAVTTSVRRLQVRGSDVLSLLILVILVIPEDAILLYLLPFSGERKKTPTIVGHVELTSVPLL
jgi:hypothetical protein